MPNRYFQLLDRKIIFLVFAFLTSWQITFSQTPIVGDYRTRTSGDWAGLNTWQVRTAVNTWVNTTTAPTSANNIYIQIGHTVTASSAVSCNNIHFGFNPGKGTLILGANTLSVNGKIRCYNGAVVTSFVDGIFYTQTPQGTLIPEDLITTTSGLVKFVGNSRDLTDLNAWATFGTAFAAEFALNSGQTGTLNTGFKAKSITFSSGSINTLTYRIAADPGTTDGGDLTIKNGAKLITGNDIIRTNGATGRSNKLQIEAGGTLAFTKANPGISFVTIIADPASTVLYDFAGDQAFAVPLNSGMPLTTYGNLELSNTGTKTMIASTAYTIKGNFLITAPAVFLPNNNSPKFEKNWTNWGSAGFTEGSVSTMEFSGANAQIINTVGGEDFYKVLKTGAGTLTQSSDVRFSVSNSSLIISGGIWDASTYNLTGVASTSLSVTAGTLSQATLATIPQIIGTTTFNTGATLELYGSGAQQLRGGLAYKNLRFTGMGIATLAGDPASITGTVTIANTHVLDIGNSDAFGNASTNLTMTGGRFKMSGVTSNKPDIDGTYSLTGGVIEFYGSAVTRQNIKGKTGAGATDINYYNIEVSGSNVGMGLYNITMLSNPNCTFKILTGGTFTINDNTIRSSIAPSGLSKFAMEAGATLNCGNNQGFHGYTQAGLNSSAINSNITASSITLTAGSTVIYSGAGNQPITNTLNYQNLTIDGTGIKTASSGNTTVQGNFTKSNTSTFAHNNGTLVMLNTSAGQSIYCSSATPVGFGTLWVSNTSSSGLNIQNDIAVENKLQFSSAIKLYLQSGNIIMKSSVTRTANIGPILGGSTVIDYPGTGRFIIERFINIGVPGSHAKSWQLLATPTNGGQTVKDAWQEGNAPLVTGTAGLGTMITNNIAGTGFDKIEGIGPSMKTYIPSSNSWKGINRTDTTLYNPNGYMIFIRGDRSVVQYNDPATNTTLRTKGKIFFNYGITGATNPPPSVSVQVGKFQTVGNPHASRIDYSLTNRSNLAPFFYVWDPKRFGLSGYGAYETFYEDPIGSGQYKVLVGGGSYGPQESVNNMIESGQAFFVLSDGVANGSISFPESCKVDGSNLVTRTAHQTATVIPSIKINLISNIGEGLIADALKVDFDNSFDNAINEFDGRKIQNIYENISINKEGDLLAIERRSLPSTADTIWLNLGNLRAQDYQFDFSAANFTTATGKPVLVDRFLNETMLLSETENTSYQFTAIASQAGSYASNRFCIVFKKAKNPMLISELGSEVISGRKSSSNNNEIQSEFQVYPNPVQGNSVNLVLPSLEPGNYLIEISDGIGKLIKSNSLYISAKNINLDISGLQSGVYIVSIKGLGYSATRKFVVNK